MSAHPHTPVTVDADTLKQAHNIWAGYTFMIKYGIIAVIALLVGMAVFLV